MDPAIMSTSVNFGKGPAPLSAQQQELFAKFNALGVGVGVGMGVGVANGKLPQWAGAKLPLWGASYANLPLPPGFAPAKPPQLPAECIDAK